MAGSQEKGARQLMDLAPDYWRILVRHAPRTAVDRLMRDIRSEQFAGDGLRTRARELARSFESRHPQPCPTRGDATAGVGQRWRRSIGPL